MIGKITTGQGYGGTIEYVLGPGERNVEDRAHVLWHTMESDNPQHWAIEMEEHARALNPDLVESGRSDLVVHVSLSAAPGERLSKDQWIAVASEYMRQMGWEGHDHIIVQHNDRPHDHIHLIINRVGQDGQTADLHNDYQRQAAALEKIEKQFGLSESHSLMRQAAEQDPSKAVESLTRSHLTFTGNDVERYFTRLGFDDDKAQELAYRALGANNVLGTEDGRYTTTEVRKEVKDLDDRLAALAGRTHGPLPLLAGAVDPEREPSADQKQVRQAIAEGNDLTVIQGIAGTGKTTVVKQARADLEANGYDVIGAAPTGKAAKGLQAETGIESSTIASLLGSLARGSKQFDSSTVLVIDEAAMARLDDISKLANHILEAGGRMVLLGDDKQLQAVGRGGALALAEKHAGATVLDTVFRQRDTKDDVGNVIVDRSWMREATQDFGYGRTAEAIQAYADHGDIKWSASVGSSIGDLILDYAAAVDKGWKPEQMLVMAHKNDYVYSLNYGIREELKERGLLQDERTYDLTRGGGKGSIELAVGDRVVFEKNQKGLGISEEDVKNGMFGTVVRADIDGFTVQLDKGSVVHVDPSEYGHIDYGYAATVHKSQGASIDKTFGLATGGMDSHLTYVESTRHVLEFTMYANKVEFKTLDALIEKLSRSGIEEKFDQIVNASVEQKLATLYGLNEQQVEKYLADHPDVAEKIKELGISPGGEKSYLEDVKDVIDKYIGTPEMPSFGPDGPPGHDAFRDAFQEWRAALDAWRYDPLVPMNPTEQVIYAVLEGAVDAVWNGMVEGIKQGLDSESPGLLAELTRVTLEHAAQALEGGIDKIGNAVLSEVKAGRDLSAGTNQGNGSDHGAGQNSSGIGVRYAGGNDLIEREQQNPSTSPSTDQCQNKGADQSNTANRGADRGTDSYAHLGQNRGLEAGAKPAGSSQGNSGPRPGQGSEHSPGAGQGVSSGQGQDKGREYGPHDPQALGDGANRGTASKKGADAGAQTGPSSSNAGSRSGQTNEHGKGVDRGATRSSGKPGLEPQAAQCNSGSKGAEQGGSSPGQRETSGTDRGSTPGGSSEKGASRGASRSGGKGSEQRADHSGPRSGSTPSQRNGSARGAGERNSAGRSAGSRPGKGARQSKGPNAGRRAGAGSGNSRPGTGGPSNTGSRPGQQKPVQQQKPGQTKPGSGQSGTKPGNGQNNSSNSSGNDKGYGRERYR